MAAKVGSLVVEMSANVARLQRDFNTASRQATGVARKFKTIFKGVGLSIAAGLSVAGLKGIVSSSIDAADAIAKGAAKANIATSTYQELTFALDKFDVSQEMAASGLAAFTKRLGEARSGTGALTTFLKKYDQALLDSLTSAESNEQALNLFMKALGEVANDADRAALSAAAFSRSAGIGMASAFKDGGVALEAWRRKIKALGIVIDDKLLKQAEEAKDQLSALGQVIRTRTTVAIAEIAPQISSLAESLATVIPDLKAFAEVVASIAESGVKAWGAIKELNEWTDGWLKKINDHMPVIREFRTILAAIGKLTKESEHGATGSWGEPEAPAKTVAQKAVEATTEATKKAKEAVSSYTDEVASRAAEIYKATRTAKEQFVEQVAELDFMRDQGLLDPETYKRAFNDLGEEYASTVEQMKGETDSLSSSLSDAAADLGMSFSSALEDAIVKAKDFGDILSGLAEDITRILVRKSVTEPMANWASSFASGLFSGGSTAGGKAVGGPVSAGRSFLVGEAGPEIFMPQTAGSIIPNSRLGGEGGASESPNYNIFIQAADAKSFSDMCKRNPQAVIAPFEESLRLGNKGLRSSLQTAR